MNRPTSSWLRTLLVSVCAWIYRTLTWIALPCALLRLLWKSHQHPGYLKHWPERLGFAPRIEPGNTLWVHAVSVGEVINAMILVEALQASMPQTSLLITTSTPTGRERLQSLAPPHSHIAYFPYDTLGCVRRFLKRTNPAGAILIESEIWPHTLQTLHQAAIPCLLVNARLSARSARRYAQLGPWLQDILSQINWVGAQTRLDAKRYTRLGALDVACTGNLKCDRQPQDTWFTQAHHVRESLNHRPTWIAASTHPGEEEVCLATHQTLRVSEPHLVLILVPRHPHRCPELQEAIERKGLSCHRWSQGPATPTCDILLVDALGLLPMLYAAADWAFVGGSLESIGGHNPIEPALTQTPIITGHQVYNFRLLYAQLRRAKACIQVHDSQTLSEACHQLMKDKAQRQKLTQQATWVLQRSTGALERYVQAIQSRLINTVPPREK